MSERPNRWRPLERAEYLETHMRALWWEYRHSECWVNDLYQVLVRRGDEFDHINIRRRDGMAIKRDWRHFQEIKNQLCGPEREGVELYPAESRLVDTGNKYHIYVPTDPAFRFPFGWTKRDVDYRDHGHIGNGYKQRKL